MNGFVKYITVILTCLISIEPGISQDGIPADIEQYLQFAHLEGLSTCSLDVEGAIAQQGVRNFNPMLKAFYADPSMLPVFLEGFSEKMLDMHASIVEKSQYAFRLMGAPAGGIGPPLAGTGKGIQPCRTEEELTAVVKTLVEEDVILEPLAENSAWESAAFSVRNLVIYLIRAMEDTEPLFLEYRKSILFDSERVSMDDKEAMELLIQPLLEKELSDCSAIYAYEHADMRKLSYASRKLMEHLNASMMMISKCRDDDIPRGFFFSSKYGNIAMLGVEDDTIRGAFALLIDLGGDDVYMGGIASSSDIPGSIGILIDRQGNDTYRSDHDMSVCQAGLGAAVLIDMAGNDTYEVKMSGLSSSIFGFSYLYDTDGDDQYLARNAYSLGSAICGIAILDDLNGNDLYLSGSYSQGFAGPGGVGILMDSYGDDEFGSPDNEGISFVQGASKGRWAEATDGHSLSGGYGFLVDGGGNDQYHASSFAQGAGYYFGAGFVFDKNGNDAFNTLSHSQAYGVHYSLGCLVEVNGNDLYNLQSDTSRLTQLIASGRDHSAGVFLEIEGEDEYCFGNRSVGISDMEGVGVFIDLNGSDVFHHFRNNIYPGSSSMGKTFKSSGMMQRFSISPLRTIPFSIFMDVE